MATAIATPPPITESPPIVLQLPRALQFSEAAFFEFCQLNRDLRIERTAEGDLVIMAPTGFDSGEAESEINLQLRTWAKRNGTGTTVSSSGGFRLPNGAVRSPDASWISQARLATITAEQRRKFLPLCPDFLIALRSPSDSLVMLQAKMEEYMVNGAQLGMLLDPDTKTVFVYRPQQPMQTFIQPERVSGEPELPGFELVLTEIW